MVDLLILGGIVAIIVIVLYGISWISDMINQDAQRARDQEALEIYNQLINIRPGEKVRPYSLYLRPFLSTGYVRIPLKSEVYKRGVLAGPSPGIYDPELGKTTRYKRYVKFGDFETELASLVKPQLPLIGLGREGEQIGAGRIESDDKNWRAKFNLLAKYAMLIFLVPSSQAGTRWELNRILNDGKLLRKTVIFIPPSDRVLGGEVGPHLGTGAKAGPVGALDLRRDAIKALVRFVPKAPLANIEKDEWGVFLKLTEHRSVGTYHALKMVKEFSLNPSTVGSNLHIDLDDLQRVILGFIS